MTRMRTVRTLVYCCIAAVWMVALAALPAIAQEPAAPTAAVDQEWRHYGSDRQSSKYSPADQIDENNVAELEVAWRWQSPDGAVGGRGGVSPLKVTPILVDGVLYAISALNLLSAINPITGEELWRYDPKAYEGTRPTHGGLNHRGLESWTGPRDPEAVPGDETEAVTRLVYGTGTQQLISIDPRTGKPDPAFGEGGVVDMRPDVAEEKDVRHTGLNSPPIVCADTIIVGMVVNDFGTTQKMPVGHVRGYDVRTGEKRWTFHSIPQGNELGTETWEEESWRYSGNTNVWSLMSCDNETGIAYLPFGTPTNDHYGGHRLGNNLYAESLVAVDAATGKRVWHFQGVHHGLWDYDFPCAPNLIDVTVDGELIPAVAQVSKQGYTYVLNRVTGKPVWPIEERKVAPSTVPGERASETQPIPSKPPPFDLVGIGKDDLLDLTPEIKEAVVETASKYKMGPLFTPPIVGGEDGKYATIISPGLAGGANWGGAAVDPESGVLFVPSQTRVMTVSVAPPSGRLRGDLDFMRQHPPLSGPGGLPITKPPWSRITAIDLNKGEILWQVAHGEGPKHHPALEGLELEALGSWPLAGLAPGWPMATKTLLFAAQGVQGIAGGETTGYLRAYDKASGDLVWEKDLGHPARGAPMTYVVDGQQFIVVAIGDASKVRELVAFALPTSAPQAGGAETG